MKIINKLLMIAVIAGSILAYNEYKYNQLKFMSMSADYKLIQEIIKLFIGNFVFRNADK